MTSDPGNPTITPLRPYGLSHSFPTCRLLCGSWWTAWSSSKRQHTWRACTDSLLATTEPLSVIIPSLRDPIDPVIAPEPRWHGPVPDWQGIPCTIGRVEVWLPDRDPLMLRPFSLLVLLLDRDPPELLPYVLLGVQFLIEHQVTVSLDCSQPVTSGYLELP